MAITAEQVKALRDQTGAGMMECKKALLEADGDFEKAVTLLRERGLAAARSAASTRRGNRNQHGHSSVQRAYRSSGTKGGTGR